MEEIHVITMTISSMRIRPSSIHAIFQSQIKRIGKKSCECGEKFSQPGLKEGFSGLAWASGGKLDGGEI
jgi:hypothetical protein